MSEREKERGERMGHSWLKDIKQNERLKGFVFLCHYEEYWERGLGKAGRGWLLDILSGIWKTQLPLKQLNLNASTVFYLSSSPLDGLYIYTHTIIYIVG